MRRIHRLCAAVLMFVAVVAVVAAACSGSAADGRSGSGVGLESAEATRLLVFSVPTLSWADLDRYDAPTLRSVLERSAIAALSTRSTGRTTSATVAYATLNAGTRARGAQSARIAFVAGPARTGSVDSEGDPQEPPSDVFEKQVVEEGADPDELLGPDEYERPAPGPVGPTASDPAIAALSDPAPTSEEFARRTGLLPAQGRVFNYGLVSLLKSNDESTYDPVIGSLGTELGAEGISTAVIANGDHPEGDNIAYRREASLGLMNEAGMVDAGRVGGRLLRNDVSAPFGTRFDLDEVEHAFERFWKDRAVLLVEASDLVRYEDFRPFATSSQQRALKQQAIRASDALLERLLTHVDLDRDKVVIVAPYAEANRSSLTVFGIHAPDVEPGLVSSATTRRSGFFHLTDVAPTVLSLMGVEPPSTMAGTPAKWSGQGGSFEDRRAMLDRANEAALFRDTALVPATTVFIVSQLILWGLAVWALSSRDRRVGSVVEVAALSVLGFLPATFIAAPMPFYRWGMPAYWAFVAGVAISLGLAARLVGRRWPLGPAIAMLGFIVAFVTVDLFLGGIAQFNSVFGHAPTIAGRFVGLTNNAFSMYAAAAVLLAAMLAHVVGGRRGAGVAVGLLLAVLVVDGMPTLGADVGGILTLVPTIGVAAAMLYGYKVRLRALLGLFVGAVVLAVGFGLIDLLRPPSARSHLGRLLADIGDNGFEALYTVVFRKLDANLSVITRSVWTLMIPVVFACVGYLLWRAPWRLEELRRVFPEQRMAVTTLLVLALLGFALNDSGISLPGMMLGVGSAWLVHLLVRLRPDEPVEAPRGPVSLSDPDPDPELVATGAPA